jgi:hypothetical protein
MPVATTRKKNMFRAFTRQENGIQYKENLPIDYYLIISAAKYNRDHPRNVGFIGLLRSVKKSYSAHIQL